MSLLAVQCVGNKTANFSAIFPNLVVVSDPDSPRREEQQTATGGSPGEDAATHRVLPTLPPTQPGGGGPSPRPL